VANAVVYTGSFSGFMYAMDARTGEILWSFDSGGSVIDGPAIADGVVYGGSGQLFKLYFTLSSSAFIVDSTADFSRSRRPQPDAA
jgi:outer membrane protein assembly factor BamB